MREGKGKGRVRESSIFCGIARCRPPSVLKLAAASAKEDRGAGTNTATTTIPAPHLRIKVPRQTWVELLVALLLLAPPLSRALLLLMASARRASGAGTASFQALLFITEHRHTEPAVITRHRRLLSLAIAVNEQLGHSTCAIDRSTADDADASASAAVG